MNIDSQKYWEQRYQSEDAPWDMGMASPPLMAFMAHYPNKDHKILIPGGGKGYELAWLHTHGFQNSFLIDWSPTSCAEVLSLHPAIPASAVLCKDFFAHSGQYDLILEQTFFCALTPPLREDYARHMHALLKPGGRLVGVWFQFPLTEAGPPFGGSADAYQALFEPLFSDVKIEPCKNSHPARMGKELWIELTK